MLALCRRCLPCLRGESSSAFGLSPHGVALPKRRHQSLHLKKDSRIVIVGDVHGCFQECEDLLQKCQISAYPDTTVIFVGDLVNKGPLSVESVRLARRVGAYCVRGNHDDLVLKLYFDAVGDVKPDPKYSNMSWVTDFTREEINWLLELPLTLRLPEQNVVVTHAGVIPDVSIEEQRPQDLLEIRNIVRKSDVDSGTILLQDEETPLVGGSSSKKSIWCGTKNPKVGKPWVDEWSGPEHIVYGHDAVRGLQLRAHATGLDTGCVYGNKLTALILPTRDIVQVSAKRMYVDPHKPKSWK